MPNKMYLEMEEEIEGWMRFIYDVLGATAFTIIIIMVGMGLASLMPGWTPY